MLKRYAHRLMIGLLFVALSNMSVRCDNDSATAKNAQKIEACVAATSGAYAHVLKNYVAQLYARCKDCHELCGLGIALVCAYIVYTVCNHHEKVEIDFGDFEHDEEKGQKEQQV